MTYENIVFEKEEAVGILLINRPKSLNALNPATLNEIADCLDVVQRDTGAALSRDHRRGRPGFCCRSGYLGDGVDVSLGGKSLCGLRPPRGADV